MPEMKLQNVTTIIAKRVAHSGAISDSDAAYINIEEGCQHHNNIFTSAISVNQ